MWWIRSRRTARHSLDTALAERLIEGRGAPADAPADQHALARLLEVAASPGSEQELTGEVAAAAMYVQVTEDQARARRVVRRSLAAVACVLAVGGIVWWGSMASCPPRTAVPARFGVPTVHDAVPAPDISAVHPGQPGNHPRRQNGYSAR
jgi:hypothetical protein